MYGKVILVSTRHDRGVRRLPPRISRRVTAAALGIATVAGGAIVIHALASPAKISLSANARHENMFRRMPGMVRGSFMTVNNRMDPTFNQLLGINNRGQIAGYFGSGAAGHPNMGYLLHRTRHGSMFRKENFPRAMQTQVTGLNDRGVTVGFWSSQNMANEMNNNFGFVRWHGRYYNVNAPARNNSMPPVNQLLGVNDRNIAVGFYTNGQGLNRGYEYNIMTRHFSRVLIPGIPNLSGRVTLTATAINNMGDVAGFYQVGKGKTKSFLKMDRGRTIRLSYPGASSTQAFGVNDWGEVVGTYMMGTGDNAKSYGFTWTRHFGFRSVNDPMGNGTTTINGVNNAGDLVGFYTDAMGNTDGLLWMPMGRMGHMPVPMPSQPMPSQSMTPPMSTSPSMMPSSGPTSATSPASGASPPGGAW
jgi:hypothetical protein